MKRIIILSIALLLFASPAWAADQIAECDFEGLPLGAIAEDGLIDYGVSYVCRPFRDEHSQGFDGGVMDIGGEHGKVAKAYVQDAYVDGDSYSEPKFRFDDKFGPDGTQEIFVKFDFRMDEDLGATPETREVNDFKFLRITSHHDASTSSSAHWHPQLIINPGSPTGYGWYSWTKGSGYPSYNFGNAIIKRPHSIMDHNWHTFYIYVHIGTHVASNPADTDYDGTVIVWFDGFDEEHKILEDHQVPMRSVYDVTRVPPEGLEVKSCAFIRHAKYFNSPADQADLPMEGHLYFDNLEVWDGMPDAADYQMEIEVSPISITVPRGTGFYLDSITFRNLGDAADYHLSANAYEVTPAGKTLIAENLKAQDVHFDAGQEVTYGPVYFRAPNQAGLYSLELRAEFGDHLFTSDVEVIVTE